MSTMKTDLFKRLAKEELWIIFEYVGDYKRTYLMHVNKVELAKWLLMVCSTIAQVAIGMKPNFDLHYLSAYKATDRGMFFFPPFPSDSVGFKAPYVGLLH